MSISARRLQRVAQPNQLATIYGVNCALSSWAGSPNLAYATRGSWFGRIPCGRGWYNAGAFPSNGGNFTSGGTEWGIAGGVFNEKRANINFQFPGANQAQDLANGNFDSQLINYIDSVPSDWTIYLCYFSEYNLHIGTNTAADFKAAFIHLGELCAQYASEGNVVPTICNSSFSWDNSYAPLASEMPSNTLFIIDAYGNPGPVSGHKNYASPYPTPASVIDSIYNDIVEVLGYQHWGIGEFNTPQRVAPALGTLNSRLGWGPLSPADSDGSLRAQWISDYCDYLQTKPVKPQLVLLWEGGNGSWNQLFTSVGSFLAVGTDTHDDWLDGSTPVTPGVEYQATFTAGPLNQAWPTNLTTTVQNTLINSYKPFITTSP